MARDKHIVLTDEEYQRLTELTEEIFGEKQVPWGMTIRHLMDEHDRRY